MLLVIVLSYDFLILDFLLKQGFYGLLVLYLNSRPEGSMIEFYVARGSAYGNASEARGFAPFSPELCARVSRFNGWMRPVAVGEALVKDQTVYTEFSFYERVRLNLEFHR